MEYRNVLDFCKEGLSILNPFNLRDFNIHTTHPYDMKSLPREISFKRQRADNTLLVYAIAGVIVASGISSHFVSEENRNNPPSYLEQKSSEQSTGVTGWTYINSGLCM